MTNYLTNMEFRSIVFTFVAFVLIAALLWPAKTGAAIGFVIKAAIWVTIGICLVLFASLSHV